MSDDDGHMLPVTVLAGWLGSGKTTLVNRLLRAPHGHRLAVLVNDFGDTSIDADLIESRDGAVLSLAGGCLCCALGSDLVEGLIALRQRWPGIDRVLIETSGLARPEAVARAVRLVPGFRVEARVVLACAPTVRERAFDEHVGDLVQAQLGEADLLVVNQIDRVDAAQRAAVGHWLNSVAPGRPQIEAARADVPPALILGHRSVTSPVTLARPLRGLDRRFAQHSLRLPGRYRLKALADALAAPALGLLRAKGVLRDTEGRWRILQGVGARIETPSPDSRSAVGRGERDGALVVIGLRDRLDPASVNRCVEAARLPD